MPKLDLEFHPIANLFPLMRTDEFSDLKRDIKTNGLREAIWLHDGKIIDGRNRYRACIELGIMPQYQEWDGNGSLLMFIVSLNLCRRHLTASQKAALAVDLLPWLEAEAKKRQATSTGGKHPQLTQKIAEADKGESREIAAKIARTNRLYIAEAKKIKQTDADLFRQISDGDVTVIQAKRLIIERQKKADLARPVIVALPEGLHRGDFYELSRNIPDNSVDLIFTDPPYLRENLNIYEKAAEVAARILKPGGSFVAYVGQRHLIDVANLVSRHLRYWWTCAAVHTGGNAILNKIGVRAGWKPLLWYVKGTRGDTTNIFVDAVRGAREKDSHEWQQSVIEAKYFIEKLTAKNGLVVDFFLGSGTTALASKQLERRFIGFEINAQSIENATKRIA